jgi:acetyl esterase/lipase
MEPGLFGSCSSVFIRDWPVGSGLLLLFMGTIRPKLFGMKTCVVLIVCLLNLLPVLAAETPDQPRSAVQRLEPEHLKAVHDARLRFASERRSLLDLGVYEDFRAVLHVHAEDSDHTKGTRQQVLDAAKKTGVRVVMFSDHGGPKPDTWHGLRDGVLFFAGEENGGAGFIRFPNFGPGRKPLADGELRFLSHVEERLDAATTGFTGMEICNRHTDAKLDKSLYLHLLATMINRDKWQKLVESFKAYPDEWFAADNVQHTNIFAKWDSETQKHPLTGIAGNDAHQNQIYQGTTFDPYEVSFRNLCTHILARELTEPEIRQALRDGHVYVSHDWLCDPTGFAFGAGNNLGVFPMGDSAPLLGTTRVVALTPLPARLKLIRNGTLIQETNGTNLIYSAKEPGAYRVEAWLSVDGEERPWIYSNPVYLKTPSLADLRLPSMELSPNVEAKNDLTYTDGKAEDESKHKLDLYLPKDKKLAPVFFFIHGGAWRTGDRAQYVPIGNRFAKEGILTVVPSYRLAPKNPHPAQIEDVAAAFAWTMQHVSEYGGDTNRIYVGGHSAGGHLAALLALDEKFLRGHHFSTKNIRGTLALSGVYNLTIGESLALVFGQDAQERKDASPLFHIQESAPPFVVTYCQWDYPTLGAQARQFHTALRKANVVSDLIFVPRESHISEVIAMVRDDDPTAQAILKFIQ